jgi:hypothetical protein
MRLEDYRTRRSRTYYDLDDIRGKGPELARIKWSVEVLGDWDVSPDGSQIAIPIADSFEARIRVVSLEPNPNQSRELQVLLPGMTDLRDNDWTSIVVCISGRPLLFAGRRPGLGRSLTGRPQGSLLEYHHRHQCLAYYASLM